MSNSTESEKSVEIEFEDSDCESVDSMGSVDNTYDDKYEEDKDIIAKLTTYPLCYCEVVKALRKINIYGGLKNYVPEMFNFTRDEHDSQYRFRFNPSGYYELDDYLWAWFYREFTQLKIIDSIWGYIEMEDSKDIRFMNRLFSEIQKDIEDRVMSKLKKMSKSKNKCNCNCDEEE